MGESNGKRALVTGASSGIGAAVTLRLAREGWSTILLGRDANRLRQVAASLPEPSRAQCFVCDFNAPKLERELRRISSQVRSLDALIHAAGIITNGSLVSFEDSALHELMQVNVRAPLLLTQHCLPFLQRTAGIVVFVNSSGVLRPQAQAGEYIASKHALRAVTDSLREEINGRGVRVTSIYPGRTATPMQARVHAAEGKPYHPHLLMQPEDVADVVACAVNMSSTSELVDVFMRPSRKPQSVAQGATPPVASAPTHGSDPSRSSAHTREAAASLKAPRKTPRSSSAARQLRKSRASHKRSK
jgi:short-subunit dehydrogenase